MRNRRARIAVVLGSLAATAAIGFNGVAAATPPPSAPGVAYTVLPPGNGYISGPLAAHANDQRLLYDGLEDPVAAGNLTDADLAKYYKDARVGSTKPSDIIRVEKPRPGVTISWDRVGVPHINGRTSSDVAFGAGWAIAEARLLVLELARVLGRSGVIEQVGGADQLLDAFSSLATTPQVNYSEEELQRYIDDAIAAGGAEGPRIYDAIQNYTSGINSWMEKNPTFGPVLARLGLSWPAPFKPTDVVASGIVVDNIFGSGGGNEIGNLEAIRALQSRFGPDQGRAVYEDLRMRDNRDASTHVDQRFPYPLFANTPAGKARPNVAEDPASIAQFDPGSVATLPNTAPAEPPHASNSVAIAGSRTKSGRPILVGGPQAAYTYPELVFEWELTGGGYESSGITFPGIGPFVVIGHTKSYAWTATSGGSDLVDQRVEKLCNADGSPATRDSKAYVFNGVCTPMTRPDEKPLTMWRTVHGPVTGTATVDGAPVAISRQRSSFGKEGYAALSFWKLSRNEVRNARDFARVMSYTPLSFNWTYINKRDIAYFHSGWYPVRKAGASFDFPTWGTGEWEWQRLLDMNEFGRNPQGVNPPSGQIVSWNSKPAPGWSSADNAWGVGAIQRVDLLNDRVTGLTDATPASVTFAHQDAATGDPRGDKVVPAMLAVLDGSPAPGAQLEEVRRLLAQYAASGAHRRDRNNDWFYDDPMTGFVDELYEHIVHAVFDDSLGTDYMDGSVRQPGPIDNAPGSAGSAFNSPTWYSITARELERTVGAAPAAPGVPPMCGNGSLDACRAALWKAVEATYWKLRPQQWLWVQNNVSRWSKWSIGDRIRFLPYITNFNTMRWTNRPTFEQVISFG